MIDQAEYLARRIKRESGADPAQQIDRLYLTCLGRLPQGKEKDRALAFLNNPNVRVRPNRYKSDDPGALADLAHVVLNLNEFIYIE